MRRAITLDKYEAEIDELYRALEGDPRNSSAFGKRNSHVPDFGEIQGLVKDSVLTVLDKSLHDEDDIFQAGVDRSVTIKLHYLSSLLSRFLIALSQPVCAFHTQFNCPASQVVSNYG